MTLLLLQMMTVLLVALLCGALARRLGQAPGSTPIAHRFLGLVLYLAVMMFVVRPLGSSVARREHSVALSCELLASMIAVVLASAAATEAIGVHPLFGAFLAGLCFPHIPRESTSDFALQSAAA